MESTGANQSQRSEEKQTEEWTEREYGLAEKYQVEPKLIRLLTTLLDERELGTQRNLAKYLKDLIATTKETPTEKAESEPETRGLDSTELGPDDRTQAVVKQWLIERDYATKVACILFSEYNVMDHNTGQLSDEVREQYESDILALAEKPDNLPSGVSVKEIFLSGVVAESLLTNQLR